MFAPWATWRWSPVGGHTTVSVAAFRLHFLYINDVAPPGVTMDDIPGPILTCAVVRLVGVLIVILLHDIALYAPNLFLGKG
jgi:hypothetical protein